MMKDGFSDGKALKTVKDGKKYVASFVTDVHSDDNFATLDITMNDINVSFFERKGDQLGSTYKIVF